jgi:hypothetical protein
LAKLGLEEIEACAKAYHASPLKAQIVESRTRFLAAVALAHHCEPKELYQENEPSLNDTVAMECWKSESVCTAPHYVYPSISESNR